MKFITLENLTQFLAKLKTLFVQKESGKGLSENDLSNTLKGNYDNAHTHSQSAHAPSGAQANVIESIKVNGAVQAITSKTVDITVPPAYLHPTSGVPAGTYRSVTVDANGHVTAETNPTTRSGYGLTDVPTTSEMNTAIAGAVGSAGHLQRQIVASLPAIGSADVNTIYLVSKSAGSGTGNTYDEYMAINSAWEKIGDTTVDLAGYIKDSDLVAITTTEIDALFA